MVGMGNDAVFVERPLFNLNFALTAGEPPCADAFDFNPKLARSIQQGFALLDAAAAAGGHEDNLRSGHGQWSVFSRYFQNSH